MIYPRISIVTPTYNSGRYLEHTIQSIVSQNYPNLEYIIIDGGSTDNTIEIIKKYSDFVAFWVSEPDKGMYDAINKGFQKSTGEIISWLNSDDVYHNGALFCVGRIFIDLFDVEWIIGKSSLFNSDGQCVKMNNIEYWSKSRIFTGDYRWIQQENVFWRKSLYNKAGGQLNSSLRLAGDFELWMRFFKYTKLYSVQTSFAGFRLHGQQLSIMESKMYENEVLRVIEDHKMNNLSIIIGKFLFKIVSRIGDRKNNFLLIIKVIVQLFLKKINNYPAAVYFDFQENTWKK
jgi:glycosyltransferase involved in cell wall biosynthesis